MAHSKTSLPRPAPGTCACVGATLLGAYRAGEWGGGRGASQGSAAPRHELGALCCPQPQPSHHQPHRQLPRGCPPTSGQRAGSVPAPQGWGRSSGAAPPRLPRSTPCGAGAGHRARQLGLTPPPLRLTAAQRRSSCTPPPRARPINPYPRASATRRLRLPWLLRAACSSARQSQEVESEVRERYAKRSEQAPRAREPHTRRRPRRQWPPLPRPPFRRHVGLTPSATRARSLRPREEEGPNAVVVR